MGSGGNAVRMLAVLVAALIAVAIGACGDDDETTTDKTPAQSQTGDPSFSASNHDSAGFDVDPCSLLTDEDVKAIMGESVEGELKAKANAETGQPGQCFWETGGAVDLAAKNATPFSVVVSAGDDAWYENNRGLVEEDESFEEPDGIGDEAFAGDTRGGALVDEAGITVELGISSAPSSHDAVVDALERAVANY